MAFSKALLDNVFGFVSSVTELATPSAVIAALELVVGEHTPVHVLGAARVPILLNDWHLAKLGETVFLGEYAPRGWWQEYSTLNQVRPAPYEMLARTSLASYTWTESRRMLEPIGIDRWPHELALKYGMRDGMTCPIGGRWVIVFWSPKVLDKGFDHEIRALLFLAASFAANRLEQVVPLNLRRIPTRAELTPRELAVLRLASLGRDVAEIATELELGQETVRSHIKNAQAKLGAKNRTQSVAEALRQHLIP